MIKIWVSGCCYLCRFKWDVFLKSRINVNWTLKFRQNSTMELFFEICCLFWFFFCNHSLFILERFSNLSANRVHSVLFHLKTMSFFHVVTFPFSNLMFNMSSLIFLVNSIRFASFIGLIFFQKSTWIVYWFYYFPVCWFLNLFLWLSLSLFVEEHKKISFQTWRWNPFNFYYFLLNIITN